MHKHKQSPNLDCLECLDWLCSWWWRSGHL